MREIKVNNRFKDGNFVGETAKAYDRRKKEGWFEKFAPPDMPGIDIGCGIDPLNDTFLLWDQIYGCPDATYMDGVPNDSFHTVYCMEENSPVLTKNGFKLIQDIKYGDEVWTHKKRWKKILKNNKFKAQDKLLKITTVANSQGVNVTLNHPMLVNCDGPNKYGAFEKHIFSNAANNTKFVLAKNLRDNFDVLVCPIVDYHEEISKIDLAEILIENEDVKLYNNIIKSRIDGVGDKTLSDQTGLSRWKIRGWIYHNKKPFGYYVSENEILLHCPEENDLAIKRFINVDENLMRLLGYFLADGSLSLKHGSQVSFHFNTDEKEYVNDVSNIIHSIFGIKETEIRQSNNSKGLNIRYCSKILFDVFCALFGKFKCEYKKIPKWALWVKPELQMHLIDGYFRGDGTVSLDKKVISLVTVSWELAESLRLCLFRNGIFAGLDKINQKIKPKSKIKGCGYRFVVKYTKNRFISKGGGIFNNNIISRIRCIEEIKSNLPVYGLQVEEDESYYASNIMHHNSSHILEHLTYPVIAVQNWWRITAPGGNLIISVPHRDLYEFKTELPSNENPDHKSFWLPMESDPPHTFSLAAVIATATKMNNFLMRVLKLDGEYSIEVIVQKPLIGE